MALFTRCSARTQVFAPVSGRPIHLAHLRVGVRVDVRVRAFRFGRGPMHFKAHIFIA